MYTVEYAHSLCPGDINDFGREAGQGKGHKCTDKKTVFSFMMCVYNDTSLLNRAINSLLNQSFPSWELVVLDNSDENEDAWAVIQNAMKMDNRIKGIRSSQNVGWAKGASVCMEHIRGDFVTFLSADDCINTGALEKLNRIIEEENPDVIFVGNGYATYDGSGKVDLYAENIPDYKVYTEDIRSESIVDIMQNIYYNSMFHYEKVSFLKGNGIDFFEPYYGDCASMAYAMASADKMVSLDYSVYFLTTNTSQTSGYYIVDTWEGNAIGPWQSIREVFQRENFTNKNMIIFVVEKILGNVIGSIGALCQGKVRNKYMNSIDADFGNIIEELELVLADQSIIEMFLISGHKAFDKLLQNIAILRMFYNEENRKVIERSWLKGVVLLALFRGRHWLSSEEKLDNICDFLLQEENHSCLGIDYFLKIADECNDSEILKFKKKIQLVINKHAAYIHSLDGSWLGRII